ncbi:MAG: hypothetical protein ABI347_07645 [Nitrososphaera sp.]|jgi:hypothetical protein
MKSISAALAPVLLAVAVVVVVLVVAPAFAQAQEPDGDLLPSVEGTYVSKDGLAEISFPSDWKGVQIENGSVTSAIVAGDGGAGVSNAPDYSKPLMMLIMSDNKNISDPGANLLSAASAGLLYCTPSVTQHAWINGAFGTSSTASCSAGAGNNNSSLLAKTVLVETTENWVMAGYVAPHSEFEQGMGAFGDALRSFKVFNPMAPDLQQPLISTYYDTSASGANVTMEISSTSTLKGLSLDEPRRLVHVTLNETSADSGILIMPVGQILGGPYSVSIDGAAITGDEMQDMLLINEPGGDQMLKITYPAGDHDISISGVQVVPEFPAAITASLTVILIGLAAMCGRHLPVSKGQ